MIMTGIYKITNLINGKVYIGQAKNIEKRWNDHKRDYKSKIKDKIILYEAMRKYGFENFSFEILILCEEDLLNLMEIYYIAKYRSYIGWKDSNGYNMTIGGGGIRGYKHTKKAKQKISEKLKGKYTGENCYWYGKKWSKESKEKLSKSKKGKYAGKDNPNYGNHKIARENHPKARKVVCEDMIFNCVRNCSEFYGENYGTMKGWLNGSKPMPQKWYDRGLRYIDEQMTDYKIQKEHSSGENNPKSKKVYCEDKIFGYAGECAEYYGIPPSTMRRWLNGSTPMPQEWYDKGLRYEDKQMSDYKIAERKGEGKEKGIICNGIYFKSASKCGDYLEKK